MKGILKSLAVNPRNLTFKGNFTKEQKDRLIKLAPTITRNCRRKYYDSEHSSSEFVSRKQVKKISSNKPANKSYDSDNLKKDYDNLKKDYDNLKIDYYLQGYILKANMIFMATVVFSTLFTIGYLDKRL